MTEFLGDIAFTLELLVIGLGLYFFHLNKKETSGFLKTAAYVLTIGGILTASCTTYYWFKYWNQGAFEKTHHSVNLRSSMHESKFNRPMGSGHMMGENRDFPPMSEPHKKYHRGSRQCDSGNNCPFHSLSEKEMEGLMGIGGSPDMDTHTEETPDHMKENN